MTSFLKRHWFLVCLVVLLPIGVVLARSDPPDWVRQVVRSVDTSWCTGTILFLMAITLNSGRLLDSLRRPAAVLFASGVNQVLIPLLCLPLLSLQTVPDLKSGLLIAASVPCTMAAASVWTRRANGNDAVSLLVTLLTNGFCFLVTPAWITFGSVYFDTADASTALSYHELVVRLVVAALLPAIFGQLCRMAESVRTFVDQQKSVLSNMAQMVILLLVFISAFKGGERFDVEQSPFTHTAMLIVWASCIAIHLAGMWLAWHGSGLLGFLESDRRAIAIAGSQKTLPIGLLVADATGMPLAIIPMLMYHATQLLIDTWIADGMKRRPVSDS